MKSDYNWLENWRNTLHQKNVLELGCGSGIDTKSISLSTKSVIACDLNPPKFINGASEVLTIDHSKKLPFENNSFDVIVASLCLHYFNCSTTNDIICELSRVLKSQGTLLCRVNSIDDLNYGALGYPEIEKNMFCVKGNPKRFFTKIDVYSFFPTPWEFVSLEQKSIDRYEKVKVVWEFGVVNA